MGAAITDLDCRLKKEGRGKEEARAEETAMAHCGRGKGRGEGEEGDGLRRRGCARAARPMGLTGRKVRRFLFFFSNLFQFKLFLSNSN
jgi:hypothetical protein